MKFFKFNLTFLAILFTSMLFLSCSDSDDPKPDPTPEPESAHHFDLWVSTGNYGGAGSGVEALLVQGFNSLEGQETVNFDGKGVDVIAKLFQETIVKGEYYYQVPQDNKRFGKYKISNDGGVQTIAEFPLKKYSVEARRYAHTWTGDNTLVLMAANGDKSKIIWIKVDTEKMLVVDEGELGLDLSSMPKGYQLSTSGLASYRKADNMIIYTYQNNKDKSHIYAAFVNANDMSVKSVVEDNRVEQLGSSAYGELLTTKTVFDEQGNFYLVCANQIPESPGSTQQYSTILKINKGAYEFDKNYMSFLGKGATDYERGKIVTIDYLANNKALLYIQSPKYTGASKWGSDYNCYYAVLDLVTDQLTDIKLPYCEGTLAQRSVVIGDKAYIGVNPKTEQQAVYTYEIKTGKITKGITIKAGYQFQRIMNLEKQK